MFSRTRDKCPIDGGAMLAGPDAPDLENYLVCSKCAEILAPDELVRMASPFTRRRYLRSAESMHPATTA